MINRLIKSFIKNQKISAPDLDKKIGFSFEEFTKFYKDQMKINYTVSLPDPITTSQYHDLLAKFLEPSGKQCLMNCFYCLYGCLSSRTEIKRSRKLVIDLTGKYGCIETILWECTNFDLNSCGECYNFKPYPYHQPDVYQVIGRIG
jgi:hypothetical protein